MTVRSKDFINSYREKTSSSEESTKSRKLCWRKNKEILDYRLINRTTRVDMSLQSKGTYFPDDPSNRRDLHSGQSIVSVEVLRTSSETIVFHNVGNPARANIKPSLGYRKDGDGDGNSQFMRCQNSVGGESHLAIQTSGHGAAKENHRLDDGAYLMVCILVVIDLKYMCFLTSLTDRAGEAIKQTLISYELRVNGAASLTIWEAMLKHLVNKSESDPLKKYLVKYEGVRISGYALCKVVVQPDSVDAWVRLLLFPRCTLQVYRPKNRQELKSILDGSALGSFGQGESDFIEEGATGNTNIKQSLRNVADEHFTTAVKVLSSSGVAPYCDDTIKALEAKHPYKPPHPCLASHFLSLPLWFEGTTYVGCIMWRGVCYCHISLKVSGGAEAILHSVNRVLSEYHNDGSFAMLTVDFSNAFNLVDRSALLHEIKDSWKLLLHAWYLDDGTVIGDSEEVARVLNIIKLREGLFPVNIQRPSSGVKLLGEAVSRDADLISGLAMRRAVNAVDLMSLLPQLHDPQSELLFVGNRYLKEP
ncbi:hypothetical protein Tco_1406265 [Tanacetum coccineum]